MKLLFVGLDVEAEGKDRQSLELPGHQTDLLRDAYTYGQNLVITMKSFNHLVGLYNKVLKKTRTVHPDYFFLLSHSLNVNLCLLITGWC